MAQSNPSLPVNYQPHDSLRLGLPAYKEEYAAPHAHPVAAVVAAAASSSASGDDARRNRALADVYGAGLAARMAIEKQILCRPTRLPGGPIPPAARDLGWHALTGELDEFDVGSYLGPGAGVPGQESEELPRDLHSQAERMFGLGTERVRRAT